MSDPTIPAEALPELGTAEAAVRSCVNLISRATGQPEQLLAYWLDLYFQVRLKLEQPPAPPVQGSTENSPQLLAHPWSLTNLSEFPNSSSRWRRRSLRKRRPPSSSGRHTRAFWTHGTPVCPSRAS